MTRKIGTFITKPYNNSLIYNIRGRLLGTMTDFVKNVDNKIKQYCNIETQLSHAYGFNVKLEKISECGNQEFFNITKIYRQ